MQDLADIISDLMPGVKTDKLLQELERRSWYDWLVKSKPCDEDSSTCDLSGDDGPNTTTLSASTSTLCSLLSTPSNTPQESKPGSDLSQAAAGTLENEDVYRRLTMTLRSDAHGDRKQERGSH